MKNLLFAAVLTAAAPAWASDVGVSISIGQPGFYGRIDIGGYPQPQLIYRQPQVVYQSAMHRPPVYLHVPPGHAKNWSKHCGAYNACDERVYFVQDSWYAREYVPLYQEQHRGKHDGHPGNDHGHGHKH